MSAKTTGHIWDLKLPHAEMLVLLAMADEADHRGGHISASVGLIAWKAGYSERQVHRIIHDLTAAGLLVLIHAELGAANTYRIDLSAGQTKPEYYDRDAAKPKRTPDKMSYPPLTKRHTPPDKMAREGRQNVTPTPDILSIDSNKYHIESDHESPTPTTRERKNGVGGDSRTFEFLTNEAISAAAEFADLPYDVMRADYDARRKDGQSKANIVRAWRLKRPTTAYHYAPAASSAPLAATRPNVPDAIVSPAEVARRMRESR